MSGPVFAWSWAEWDVLLHVPETVQRLLLDHRQRANDHERGGQLFADLRGAEGMRVAIATLPHRRDRAGRQWLELDRKRCREELLRAAQQGLHLIGYWHTHPETIPHLSSQDVQSFRAFTRVNAPSIRYPVCVIVGHEAIRAWSIREYEIVEATRINFEPKP